MSDVKYTPGRFVWRDLSTPDVGAAKRFYGELLGWTFEDRTMGHGGVYSIIQSNGNGIGGLMKPPPGMEAPAHWVSYVSVKDVDAAAKTWAASGGTVGYGPEDIPEVGRFAALIDPWGASLHAFKSTMGDPPVAMPKNNEFCWESLNTADVEKAKALYTKTFGWTLLPGPAGPDTVFAVGPEMQDTTADVDQAPAGTRPHWLTSIAVANVDVSRDRALKLGGSVIAPLIEVPEMGRMSIVADPTGAAFGLFQAQM